jgi:hypothetical protein
MLRIAPMTGAKKPGPREEREGNRKTIVQEKPDRSGEPVVTYSCAFYSAREAAGASGARLFLRPLSLLRANLMHSPGARAAGTERACMFGLTCDHQRKYITIWLLI